MDRAAFDRVSKLFAARAARRSALAGVGAAGVAALATLPDAEAKPGKGKAGAAKRKGKHKPKQLEKTTFLFLQTARAGTLADNGDGSYDLVLEGHHGGTAYFSDRPQRVFGVSPTEAFLDGLGFPADNPPNAALLVKAGDVEDVAIVELFDPAYDEATGRLTYRVKILAGYDENGLQHIAQQVQDDELPAAFDQASLFIDDCNNYVWCCNAPPNAGLALPNPDFSGHQTGKCWSWSTWNCEECWAGQQADLDAVCRAQMPGIPSYAC